MLAFVGLCWPSLAFLAFLALDDFFKQKLAFVDKKLSTIDLFPTIRCQNQLPNEIGHFETLCSIENVVANFILFVGVISLSILIQNQLSVIGISHSLTNIHNFQWN